MQVPRREPPDGSPARGCLIGMLISAVLWAVIVFLLLLLLNRLHII